MKLLIFDLDGTLIDSQLDLAYSVNAMRTHMGLPELPHETVYSYVGNGAPVLVQRALGPEAAAADVERGLAYFLQYYRAHMLDNTVLYPGVRETLGAFRDAGIPMAVLTNKPVVFSEDILTGLGLAPYFFRVYGGNSFDRKKPDPIGIETLMQEMSAPREGTMMIGDSAVDVRTARNAGVKAVGVTYGIHPHSLKTEPPDILLDNMADLAPIVLV